MISTLAPILTPLSNLLAQEARADARPTSRCAWCDAESGRKPSMTMMESHGICARHLAQTKSNLEALRRQEVGQ